MGLTWMILPAAVLFSFDSSVGRKSHCNDLFKHRRHIAHEHGKGMIALGQWLYSIFGLTRFEDVPFDSRRAPAGLPPLYRPYW